MWQILLPNIHNISNWNFWHNVLNFLRCWVELNVQMFVCDVGKKINLPTVMASQFICEIVWFQYYCKTIYIPGIDEFNGIVSTFHIYNRQDWAENFGLHHRIFWLNIYNNRWFNKKLAGIWITTNGNFAVFHHTQQSTATTQEIYN